MLRQAQHERKILHTFRVKPVRPEPVEGRRHIFSPHFKKETYSSLATLVLWQDIFCHELSSECNERAIRDYPAALLACCCRYSRIVARSAGGGSGTLRRCISISIRPIMNCHISLVSKRG